MYGLRWWKIIAVASLSSSIAAAGIGLGAWTTPVVSQSSAPAINQTDINQQADSNSLETTGGLNADLAYTPVFSDDSGDLTLANFYWETVGGSVLSKTNIVFAYPTTAPGALTGKTVTITAPGGNLFDSTSVWSGVDPGYATDPDGITPSTAFIGSGTSATFTLTYNDVNQFYIVKLVDQNATDSSIFYVYFGTQPTAANLLGTDVDYITYLNLSDVTASTNFVGTKAASDFNAYMSTGIDDASQKIDAAKTAAITAVAVPAGYTESELSITWPSVGDALDVSTNTWNTAVNKAAFPTENISVFQTKFNDAVTNAINSAYSDGIAAATGRANLLGYATSDITIDNLPQVPLSPATPTEIAKYQHLWHARAIRQLNADINSAQGNAVPKMLDYSVDELLTFYKLNQPQTKYELDEFAVSPLASLATNATDKISYEAWLQAAAAAKLKTDIAVAEQPAKAVGYEISSLLGDLAKPATKSELSDFLGSQLSYEAWLLNQANMVLTVDIDAAVANARNLGFNVDDFNREFPTFFKPRTKGEIENFADNLSLTSWINDNAEKLLAIEIRKAEIRADLKGYTVYDLLGNNDKPANKTELTSNFAGSGLSYQDWLTRTASNRDNTNRNRIIIAAVIPGGLALIAAIIIVALFSKQITSKIKEPALRKTKKDKK